MPKEIHQFFLGLGLSQEILYFKTLVSFLAYRDVHNNPESLLPHMEKVSILQQLLTAVLSKTLLIFADNITYDTIFFLD